jgi:Flp pilus assembly pilin Flp
VVTVMKHSIALQPETGQTMAEYTVVLGVITFIIVATISLLSNTIDAAYSRTISILASAF